MLKILFMSKIYFFVSSFNIKTKVLFIFLDIIFNYNFIKIVTFMFDFLTNTFYFTFKFLIVLSTLKNTFHVPSSVERGI